jgi:hypothetical protein
MSLEEFYKASNEDRNKIESYYLTTLQAWMLWNKFDMFEDVLQHFEDKEEYLVCSGIQTAISRIEDIMDNHFTKATPIEENNDVVTYSLEEYEEVSKKVFKDLIIEMYERQIDNSKENH